MGPLNQWPDYWVAGVTTPLIEVITPFINRSGAHLVYVVRSVLGDTISPPKKQPQTSHWTLHLPTFVDIIPGTKKVDFLG